MTRHSWKSGDSFCMKRHWPPSGIGLTLPYRPSRDYHSLHSQFSPSRQLFCIMADNISFFNLAFVLLSVNLLLLFISLHVCLQSPLGQVPLTHHWKWNANATLHIQAFPSLPSIPLENFNSFVVKQLSNFIFFQKLFVIHVFSK